jgi:GlpG protein
MRLIGTIQGEKEAYKFYSFLEAEGIECSYEPVTTEKNTFQFWVMHEDEIDKATHWLEEFRKNAEDLRFESKPHPIDTEGVAASQAERQQALIHAIKAQRVRRPRMPLTRFIVFVCALLFIWNGYQMAELAKNKSGARFFNLTPLFIDLSYDAPSTFALLVDFFASYPMETPEELDKLPAEAQAAYAKIDSLPVWMGLYGVLLDYPATKQDLDAPLFVKLREGQIWRLFTPCLLHGGFLHILFNMLWLWMLGRQIEERIKKWQYLSITLIIGILSNTFQYLMSGPLFIGYSGVICGLAGFIWVRQKRAPWEGYPLQRATLIFLAIFIFGMLALQVVSFILMRFEVANFPMNIANTAHISGAITGAVLGRIPLFSKGNI